LKTLAALLEDKDIAYDYRISPGLQCRITPVNGQPVYCSNTFLMQATSAETNVASVSSYLGLPCKVLTTFVKDSPIARFIKDDLAGRHIDVEATEVDPGRAVGLSPSVQYRRQRHRLPRAAGP
jgi:2-dehydro-3-deoxygluconokinase